MMSHKQKPIPAISAIILAGGQSIRLGEDKSLLLLAGEPLLARVVRLLSVLSDDLLVITNDASRYESLVLPARLLPDERPGVGVLMGLYSGLKAARHAQALAVACDMPFLNLSLLRYMVPLAEGYDVVVPHADGFLEPLHALYGRGCLPAMRRALERGRRQIVSFFDEVRVRRVEQAEVDRFDPQHLSFVNVNTAQDWTRVQALLQDREPPPGTGA
jgi:molybdopterin-guanine dinucleotide biosynthesis protein A